MALEGYVAMTFINFIGSHISQVFAFVIGRYLLRDFI